MLNFSLTVKKNMDFHPAFQGLPRNNQLLLDFNPRIFIPPLMHAHAAIRMKIQDIAHKNPVS